MGDTDLLFLYSREGNDILVGVDYIGANPGRGEVNTLIGAEGNDMFLLGNATDFGYDPSSNDIIQLQSTPSTHLLGTGSTRSPEGAAIFKKTVAANELIARGQSVSPLSLDGSSLRFV
jgi:hypothetical protein